VAGADFSSANSFNEEEILGSGEQSISVASDFMIFLPGISGNSSIVHGAYRDVGLNEERFTLILDLFIYHCGLYLFRLSLLI
jgi:hypothetical protein